MVALLGIIGLAIDGGGKLRATERADAVAMEAARAAGQAIDPAAAVNGEGIRVDPEAAQAAAYAYLSRTGSQGTVGLSADRSQLTVTVQGAYATKFLSIVGIGTLSAGVTSRSCRVAPGPCGSGAPSEPDVRLSPHPAQAG
ncbi:hypothetical protein ACFVT6_38600, partial [Streptomyces sp. NPDC058049]|uniref:hypothetical protein n=1 Tax=Streptomyces sp. NPDC058049 TaxID=3346314 RepID=UPI0036E1EF6F